MPPQIGGQIVVDPALAAEREKANRYTIGPDLSNLKFIDTTIDAILDLPTIVFGVGAEQVVGPPPVKVVDHFLTGGPGGVFGNSLGQGEEAAIADLTAANNALAALRQKDGPFLRQEMATSDP